MNHTGSESAGRVCHRAGGLKAECVALDDSECVCRRAGGFVGETWSLRDTRP